MPGRPRDADGTRAAILAAATAAFARRGYDGASTRDIARQAGVDGRLITRYFGSKEGLFDQVLAAALTPSGDGAQPAGADAARAVLDGSSGALVALEIVARSGGSEQAAAIVRRVLEPARFMALLAPGATADRAAAGLYVAICAGVQLLREPVLAAVDTDLSVERLAAALDTVLGGPAATAQRSGTSATPRPPARRPRPRPAPAPHG